MPNYKDIFNLNLKYIDYLLAKTSLTQGYIHNISVTGSEIEQEVRRLLRNLLPQRFHVTHGYIISAESKQVEPAVSPQVDVIVVDTLVPHSIFIVDQQSGMEVVPIEAAVGVFEVKRTINRESLVGTIKDIGTEKEEGAIKHLRSICGSVGIRKDDPRTYLPGGVEILSYGAYPGGYHSNPIIGIISVNHEGNFVGKLEELTENKQVDLGMIDLVFSINGYLLCTGSHEGAGKDNRSVTSIHTQQAPGSWQPLYQPGKDNRLGVRIYTHRDKMEEPPPFVTYTYPPRERIDIVAKGLGFIVGYIVETCGRTFDVDKYFFNESLLEPS